MQNSSLWESGQIRDFALAARGMQSSPLSRLQHIQTSCNSLRFRMWTTIYHLHNVDFFNDSFSKLGVAAKRTPESGMIPSSARKTWVPVVWNIVISVNVSSTFYKSNENTNLMQHCAGFISAGSLYMFRAQAPIIRSI